MAFFVSKETKLLTRRYWTRSGLSALTIGIGGTLLLYKFTYGHPELRIPGMAIALFLGMWLSRVFVIGPLGFLIGFVVAVSQSVGEAVPSPELLVRGLLWLWVAIAYGVGLTVVLNFLFLPDTPARARPKQTARTGRACLFVPDAFTNPAHVHFALKVTFAAMFCYIVYEGLIGRESTPHSSLALSSRWKAPVRRCTKVCSGSAAVLSAEHSRSSPLSSSCRTW